MMIPQSPALLAAMVAACFLVVNFAVYGITCATYDMCGMLPAAVHVVYFSMHMCNFSFGLVCGLFLPGRSLET